MNNVENNYVALYPQDYCISGIKNFIDNKYFICSIIACDLVNSLYEKRIVIVIINYFHQIKKYFNFERCKSHVKKEF